MEPILFATNNDHKMQEIRMILQDLKVQIRSLKEAGISIHVEEDGQTFEENALLKATAVQKAVAGMDACRDWIVLADDSGLEIDALNREPGIYSARYLGEDTPYDVKNQNLLARLEGVPMTRRSARFVCAVAAAFPDGSTQVVRGTMEGFIAHEAAGENGFGYDPIFYVPAYSCTSAQLPPDVKNAISHRGDGLRKMRAILEQREGNDESTDYQ